MSRIDEIKERVEQFKHDWEISRGCCDVEDFSDELLLLIEENNRLREEKDSFQRVGIRTLEKLKMAEDALQTAYSYIEQTDRELNKRQLLKALEQLRED